MTPRATCAACKTPWFFAWPACEACGCPARVPVVDPNDDEPDKPEPRAAPRPVSLDDVSAQKVRLVGTGDGDVDAALGGGLGTCGSYLLSGGPGAGKSTFCLRALARFGGRIISCEMPPAFVRLLCEKAGIPTSGIDIVVPETEDDVYQAAAAASGLVVLDSLGRIPGRPNTVVALDELLEATKKPRAAGKLCVVVISQQTKEGTARGSLELEHDVDGVIELTKTEVRVTKHRLGASDTHARASWTDAATSTEKRRSR